MYEIYLDMKGLRGAALWERPCGAGRQRGALVVSWAASQWQLSQPWLSEQGEVSAKNVCCELIACVQQLLSAHPALPIVRDSEYTAGQVEPDFTGQNGGMSERGVG